MGVIKRFAIWSMVLGTLAIAGGASALAFDGSTADSTADSTAGTQTQPSAQGEAAPVAEPTVLNGTPADGTPLVSDVPSDAAAAAKAALMRWTSTHAVHAVPAE
jgi:hypothetical protein